MAKIIIFVSTLLIFIFAFIAWYFEFYKIKPIEEIEQKEKIPMIILKTNFCFSGEMIS